MAALPFAMLAGTVLGGIGLGVNYYMSKEETDDTGLRAPDGGFVREGATIRLNPSASDRVKASTCLSEGVGTVTSVSVKTREVTFRCKVKGKQLAGTLGVDNIQIVSGGSQAGGIQILGGYVTERSKVKLQDSRKTANQMKALANPFYSSIGTVEQVFINRKQIMVKTERLDKKNTSEQIYDANDLEFVSGATGSDQAAAKKGLISRGSRVRLVQGDEGKVMTKNAGKFLADKTRFAGPNNSPPFGKVMAIRPNLKDASKMEVIVLCTTKDKQYSIEQVYDLEDLEALPKEAVPQGGVAIFGGLANSEVTVKLRESRKEAVANKCLGRSAFGDTGTVTKLDPDASDNLKIFVTCNVLNPEEQTGDWYQPEDLEIAEPDESEGVLVFGGQVQVGSFVKVMELARGKKCLGRSEYGDVGVVKGIDPNAENNLVINVVCGRDPSGKVSEWYTQEEIQLYYPKDMVGTDLGDAKSRLKTAQDNLKIARANYEEENQRIQAERKKYLETYGNAQQMQKKQAKLNDDYIRLVEKRDNATQQWADENEKKDRASPEKLARLKEAKEYFEKGAKKVKEELDDIDYQYKKQQKKFAKGEENQLTRTTSGS